VAARTGGLEAGTALKEDEEGAVEAVGIGDLASEDGDLLASACRVIERHPELVLGHDEAGAATGQGHAAIMPGAAE
jgi:hypothetical protein